MSALQQAVQITGMAICYRALPVLVFALLHRSIGSLVKLALVACYALLGAVTHAWEVSTVIAVGVTYAYFLAVTAGMPAAVRALRAGTFTQDGAFVLCLVVYLGLPGVLLPTPMMPFVLLGWELALSSYSYLVENAASKRPLDRGGLFFFLFVNPVLVYTDQSRKVAEPVLSGARRVALSWAWRCSSSAPRC